MSPTLFIPLVLAGAAFAEEAVPLACSVPAGPHVTAADFSAWFPPATAAIRGMLVVVPGLNSDARQAVMSKPWQEFAGKHRFGLVGVHFTSPAKRDDLRHAYYTAAGGSGQALLDAIAILSAQGGHPEAAQGPLLLWGHSAGGQFNYEFTCWKPERVLAFVVNKGGYYSSHLAPPSAQRVPGIFFVGMQDEAFRVQSLTGIYACNRQCGALWTLAPEPGVGHAEGGTRDLALRFFEAVLPMRLPGGAGAPAAISGSGGWLGQAAGGDIWPAGQAPQRPGLVWLPDEGFASSWSAFVRGPSAGR